MRTSLINDPWVHRNIYTHMHLLWNLCTLPTKIDFVTQVQSSTMIMMIRERKSNLFVFIDFSFWRLLERVVYVSDLRDQNGIGNQTDNLFSEHVRVSLACLLRDTQDVCQNAFILNPDEFCLVRDFILVAVKEKKKRRSAIGKWRSKKVEREKTSQGTLGEEEDKVGVYVLVWINSTFSFRFLVAALVSCSISYLHHSMSKQGRPPEWGQWSTMFYRSTRPCALPSEQME